MRTHAAGSGPALRGHTGKAPDAPAALYHICPDGIAAPVAPAGYAAYIIGTDSDPGRANELAGVIAGIVAAAGRQPVPVLGVWLGAGEPSYIVPALPVPRGRQLIVAQATQRAGQDCVLEWSHDGTGRLVWSDGRITPLGRGRISDTPPPLDGYTVMPDGRYLYFD